MKNFFVIFLFIPLLGFTQKEFCNYTYVGCSEDNPIETLEIRQLEERIKKLELVNEPVLKKLREFKSQKQVQKVIKRNKNNKKLNKKQIELNRKLNEIQKTNDSLFQIINFNKNKIKSINKNGRNRFTKSDHDKGLTKGSDNFTVFEFTKQAENEKDCNNPQIKKEEETLILTKEQWYLEGRLYSELIFLEEEKKFKKTNYFKNKKKASVDEYKGRVEIFFGCEPGISDEPGIYGKLDGFSETYYENGQLSGTVNYVNGIKEGEEKSYYENGQLSQITNYVNGTKEGEEKSYYENGQLRRTTNYVNRETEGEQKSYYENGQLWRTANYVNGEIEGEEKSYYENGQLSQRTNYVNGIREGGEKDYYENGQLSQITNYVNGLPMQLEHWNRLGKLKEKKTFYSNGQEKSEFSRSYHDDEKTIWSETESQYNEEGNRIKEKEVLKYFYENGKIEQHQTSKYRKHYYENGKLKCQYTLNGLVVEPDTIYKIKLDLWYDNGTKAISLNLRNYNGDFWEGYFEGKQLGWWPDGKKMFKLNVYEFMVIKGSVYSTDGSANSFLINQGYQLENFLFNNFSEPFHQFFNFE